MIASKEVVMGVLARLHRQRHAHFAQYLSEVVGPSGLTLREAADALGVSPQRVSQLRSKGAKARKAEPFDLSAYPVLPQAPARPTRRAGVPPGVVETLVRLNAEAKGYRRGEDPARAKRFYRMVSTLHEQGISYRAIARTLGESERTFMRRLARWGVTSGMHSQPGLNVPARPKGERA